METKVNTELMSEQVLQIKLNAELIQELQVEQVTEPKLVPKLKKKPVTKLYMGMRQKLSIEEHIRRVKDEYQCCKCNRTFVCKSSVRRHLRYACEKKKQFKCPYCKYRCNWSNDIYKHVRIYHENRAVYAVNVIRHCVIKP